MNDQDREGNTPLHYAAQLETPDATEIISTILEKGADPNIRNCRNQQPLLLLMHNQDLRQIYDAFQECIHTLLYYGADPNHQSNTGCTPLHLSLHHNDIDSAIQLIDRSAELHLLWKRVSYCNDLVLFI
jgi:ankyrin repeat protein